MQRAIDVQLHYMVDHPKGESVIQKNLTFHHTFRDKRHLIILVAITQLSTHLAIDLHLQKQQKYKGHRKVSL